MRPQVPLPVMRWLVRLTVRPVLGPRLPVRLQRRWLNLVAGPAVLPRDVTVRPGSLGGRPAHVMVPAGHDGGTAVLHLHGGGFTVGGPGTHRAFAAHLAEAAGAPVHLLDYRLAPEHPFPAALDDALAAYRELLANGTPAARIAVVGDSAGGWLALAAALRLRAEGDPLPAVLGMVSPWLDLVRPERLERGDDMLRPAWLRRCAHAFAAGRDSGAPPFDVLDAHLSGLPPIVAQVGTSEILLDDAERLARRVAAQGGRIDLRRFDRLWHVAGISAGLVAEATAAVHDLGRSIAAHLPGATEHAGVPDRLPA